MSVAILVAIFKPYQNAHHSTCDVNLLLAASLAALCVASYVEAIFLTPLHYLQGKKRYMLYAINLFAVVLPIYGMFLLLPDKVINYLKYIVQRVHGRRQGYTPMDEVPHRLLYSDC